MIFVISAARAVRESLARPQPARRLKATSSPGSHTDDATSLRQSRMTNRTVARSIMRPPPDVRRGVVRVVREQWRRTRSLLRDWRTTRSLRSHRCSGRRGAVRQGESPLSQCARSTPLVVTAREPRRAYVRRREAAWTMKTTPSAMMIQFQTEKPSSIPSPTLTAMIRVKAAMVHQLRPRWCDSATFPPRSLRSTVSYRE